MARAPSEKQIRLVDEMAEALHVDFPQSSADFTARTYHKFIKNHIEEMQIIWSDNALGDELDDEMAWLRMLN